MQRNVYNIAGIGIQLVIPFACVEEERFHAFRSEEAPDISIEFLVCQHPMKDMGEQIRKSDINVFKKEHQICIEHFISNRIKPYAWLVWDEQTPEQMVCYILEEEVDNCRNIGHLFQLIRLEQIFMLRDAMVLHSSFIDWNGKGILFTAPSGTGKSTQADLWVKYQNAEIINGDRTVLRMSKHGWQASGLPYAGSSDIFRNESREMEAIVVLRQGAENEIRRLKPIEAFRYIYSEVVIRSWDEAYQGKLTDLITDLVLNVPIYMLKCLPDEGAVNELKKCLEKNK